MNVRRIDGWIPFFPADRNFPRCFIGRSRLRGYCLKGVRARRKGLTPKAEVEEEEEEEEEKKKK